MRVVVAGAGVGGLSAAIHARLAGHDVLVLEAHEVGGKAAPLVVGGYRLDPGPSIVILTEIYRDIFALAGRSIDDYLTFQRLDPITRVYFEGREGFLDLPASRSACVDVLAGMDKADAEALDGLLGKLDKVAPHVEASIFRHPIHQAWQLLDPHLIAMAGLFGRTTSYKAFVDRTFRSPLVRAFFYGFPSYGGQSYHGAAMGALLIPYYMLTRGVFYPVGGVGAIPLALERLARELRVEIRTECPVTGLRLEGRRVVGVQTSEGDVGCDALISNVDRTTTRAWLGDVGSVKPSFSYFTAHWGIRRRIPGLAHHTLLIPRSFPTGFEQLYDQRSLPDEPIVYLNATGETDPSVAPDGCTNLFAVVTSPACEEGLDWAALEVRGRSSVRAMLEKFGLGFAEDEIEFERVQTPAYFAERHGNYKGSLYGVDESQRLFGMLPERCADEQYKNLFYSGGSVQPGAGLPMVALSGKFAASLIK